MVTRKYSITSRKQKIIQAVGADNIAATYRYAPP